MSYLHNVKKTSRNTELSYQRDLMKMMHFLQKQKVEEANEVTETALNSYILDLEKNGMSAAGTAWFPMDVQVQEAETGMGGEHGTDL